MIYDRKTHGDFKAYYDTKYKLNYWLLGYFGYGPLNIVEAYQMAEEFSEAVGVPIDTVTFDEISSSSRFKYFKFITSTVVDQKPCKGSYQTENVIKWLCD